MFRLQTRDCHVVKAGLSEENFGLKTCQIHSNLRMYIFRIQFLPVNHCFQWQSIIYEEDNADVDIAINWAQFATWEKESNCKKGLWYYLNTVELQNLDTYCYTANKYSQSKFSWSAS